MRSTREPSTVPKHAHQKCGRKFFSHSSFALTALMILSGNAGEMVMIDVAGMKRLRKQHRRVAPHSLKKHDCPPTNVDGAWMPPNGRINIYSHVPSRYYSRFLTCIYKRSGRDTMPYLQTRVNTAITLHIIQYQNFNFRMAADRARRRETVHHRPSIGQAKCSLQCTGV